MAFVITFQNALRSGSKRISKRSQASITIRAGLSKFVTGDFIAGILCETVFSYCYRS